MRLSNFLDGIGRPLAYYPGMARAFGDIKEALFICQMFYWKDKGEDPDGWIYKTSEEIEQETALTYKEQTGVRDGLKAKNLLEEYYARTEHKMYFRVNWEAVNNLWDEYMTKEHMTKGKMPPKHNPDGNMPSSQKSGGSLPNVSSLNSNTENTPHITQENTNKDVDLIDGMLRFKDKADQEKPALDEFEHSLGFTALPWHCNNTWDKFRKFVVNLYAADGDVFQKYAEWRKDGGGKYGNAMTNPAIRKNPQMFIDTGYPTFAASSAMYSPRNGAPSRIDEKLAALRARAEAAE
jgi:hypothetical protein